MGLVISFLRGLTERIAIDNKLKLYLGGLIILLGVILIVYTKKDKRAT